jgi:hypothetical protein
MNKSALIPFFSIFLLFGCSNKKSDERNKKDSALNSAQINKQDCNCETVEDCLDKNNFECARDYCSKNEYSCNRKMIIESESLFWLNQNSYARAKKVALEIYSLKDLSKQEMNYWYAEKLNDIVNAMVLDEKIVEAEIFAADFPVEIEGDNTYKFKLDAFQLIAEGYSKKNMKKEQSSFQAKILQLKKQKDELNKQIIKSLEADIKQLLTDKKATSSSNKKEIAELKLNLTEEKKKLVAIQKDIYIIPGRRDRDLDQQNMVISNIESKIENLKNEIDDFDDAIKLKKEKINSIKNN